MSEHFGAPIGRLLFRHTILEEKYTTLQQDQALAIPKAEGEPDDDPVSEDTRRIMALLEEST